MSANASTIKAMSHDDWVILMGATDDGAGVDVARVRKERVELGQLRSLRAGQPIYGEVVKLTPMREAPSICAVEVQCAAPSPTPTESSPKGPSKVNSHAFRSSWERIWGPDLSENKPN
jgi:hypothetical protein